MVNWESILSSLFHQDRAKIFFSFNWGFLVCCHCHSQAVDFLSSKSGIFKEKTPGTHPYVVPWIPGPKPVFSFLSIFLTYTCAQLCPTVCNSTDCSPLGFSVHGIVPARILEWVVVSSFRGSSWPRDWTCVSCGSCIAGRLFTTEPPGKPYLSSCFCLYIMFRFGVVLTGKNGEKNHIFWIFLEVGSFSILF